MKKSKYYYDVRDDLKQGCWLNLIVGGRNTGKTYSTLRMCKEDKKDFAFTKRTNDDVKILCEGAGVGDMSISFFALQQFKPRFWLECAAETNIKRDRRLLGSGRGRPGGVPDRVHFKP